MVAARPSLNGVSRALLPAVTLALCFLALTWAECQPRQAHCKPFGAACTQLRVSECKPPYKCRNGRCGGDVPPPDPTPDPTPDPQSGCILPITPFQIRTGTPEDHQRRHPEDDNYKNVKAVDLVAQNDGQSVYAVEDGVLATGGGFRQRDAEPDIWGWQFEMTTADGRHFFYTHMKDPLALGTTPGAHVKKGQLLGWVALAPAKKPNHLHFAFKEGNPCAYLKGCKGVNGQAPNAIPC